MRTLNISLNTCLSVVLLLIAFGAVETQAQSGGDMSCADIQKRINQLESRDKGWKKSEDKWTRYAQRARELTHKEVEINKKKYSIQRGCSSL